MTSLINDLRETYWHYLHLKRISPTLSALNFAGRSYLEKSVSKRVSSRKLPIKDTPCSISMRPFSTDLLCLEEIFFQKEYDISFSFTPSVIVDAGANIGVASVYFANRYPNTKIIAIEPEKSNFELLKINSSQFRNIIPIQAALWSDCRDLEIKDPSVENWAFSVTDSQERTSSKIKGMTIDSLMSDYNINHIDVLKIDIEGAEKEIFSKRHDWIDKVSVIVIELHDRLEEGCAEAFYKALSGRKFSQELKGESVIITLN